MLKAGDKVPADMRLVETVNLKVEEASLTGESVPVEKDAAVVLDKDIPLGDRKNTAFMGTLITYGRGKGLVTGTGMNTQIGLIAQMTLVTGPLYMCFQDWRGFWISLIILAVTSLVLKKTWFDRLESHGAAATSQRGA